MSSLKHPRGRELETHIRLYEPDHVPTFETEALRTPYFQGQGPAKDPAARPNLAGRRFLVVEDEPLIGLDIVDGLEDAGAWIAGPVNSAASAIEIIERELLDGVLLNTKLHGRPVNDILSSLIRRESRSFS